MRLFIALDLDDAIRTRIAELLRPLMIVRGVKWVAPESMHITLKFIGEGHPDEIGAAMQFSHAASELVFRGTGAFPNERRPRVFWVGIEAGPELQLLAVRIEDALEPLGVVREKRAFSPHLTLGRMREDADAVKIGGEVGRILEPHRREEFGRQSVTEFHLYQSRLSPKGAQYTKVKTFPLSS